MKIIKRWKIDCHTLIMVEDGTYAFVFVEDDELIYDYISYSMDEMLLSNKNSEIIYNALIKIRDGHFKPYWTPDGFKKETQTNAEICNCDISVLMCIGCQCGGR